MPLKIPYYDMDIPRIVTALADWLACLLYLRFLPPRYGGAKRAALYGGALAALAVYLVATDGFDGWRFNVLYAVSVVLMLLFMAAATRADRWQVGYFCTRAFILAGFAGALTWQMYVYFARDIAALQSLPALVLFIAAGFGIIFGLMWLLEEGGSTGSIQFDIRPRTTCIAVVMATAIYILSSISYTQLNTPFSARGTMEIYTMRTVVYFGGVALLFAYQSQLRDLLTQREADALRNMLHIQYENYKIRQESIDLINQKYHDLKHQIAVLRAEMLRHADVHAVAHADQEAREQRHERRRRADGAQRRRAGKLADHGDVRHVEQHLQQLREDQRHTEQEDVFV